MGLGTMAVIVGYGMEVVDYKNFASVFIGNWVYFERFLCLGCNLV